MSLAATSPATMTESKSSRTSGADTGAILVTGAGGELGHALLDALAKRHHGRRPIVAMDLRELPADRAAHASATYAGDVSDPEVAERIALQHARCYMFFRNRLAPEACRSTCWVLIVWTCTHESL